MNEPAKQPLELPSATYEPQLSASIDLERCLSREVLLHVFDLSGTHKVKTCYGDVVKIVNALRNYARLLETVCDEWELGGFHRAIYEYQAEKLRQIADKFQCGIGYDYCSPSERCSQVAFDTASAEVQSRNDTESKNARIGVRDRLIELPPSIFYLALTESLLLFIF